MPHLLNKEEAEFRVLQEHPHTRHDDYSRKKIGPSLLAPAVIQSFASSTMLLRSIGGGVNLCRNTRAFAHSK